MNTQVDGPTMKRWARIIVKLFVLAFVLYPNVSGAEEKVSGRIVQHNLKVETVEMGDVPGHVMGIAQAAGLVFYPKGEIATTESTTMFDTVNGKGTFSSDRVIHHPDGSMQYVRIIGTANPMDGGKKTA